MTKIDMAAAATATSEKTLDLERLERVAIDDLSQIIAYSLLGQDQLRMHQVTFASGGTARILCDGAGRPREFHCEGPCRFRVDGTVLVLEG